MSTASITIQGIVTTPNGTTQLGPSGVGFVFVSTVPQYQSSTLNLTPTVFAVPTGAVGVIMTFPTITGYAFLGMNSMSVNFKANLSGQNTYWIVWGAAMQPGTISLASLIGVDTAPTLLLFF
jgi:hypothetical protein